MKYLLSLLELPFTRAMLALVAVFILGLVFNADGAFFKWGTHRDMLRASSEVGILACGLTIVIITAGIDLSVGSVLGLIAVLFAILTMHRDWPAWAAVLACLAAGGALGAVSGTLISRWGLQPFIATLAMMVFARGLAKWLTGGEKISTVVQQGGEYIYKEEPPIFGQIDQSVLGGHVSVVTLIFIVCVALTWFVLALLQHGRFIYAVGGNEESAHLSGVPVRWTKVLAYGLSGFFAAVAGICHAAQEHQGDPEAGATYELTAIAMVVIGGTSLMGGRGTIFLTLMGVLTIGYLEKILSLNAVGESSRLMLTGVIIVSAVLFQRRRHT